MLKTSRTSDPSLEELLAFERLLSNLSARFANVSCQQVVAEVEIALKQLLKFLDFDRGNFVEFADGGKQEILCSVALGRVQPLPLGPVPPKAELVRPRTSRGTNRHHSVVRGFSARSGCGSRILSPRWHSLPACHSVVRRWPRHGGDWFRIAPYHPAMARGVHRARKSHRRRNGSSACTNAFRGGASSE